MQTTKALTSLRIHRLVCAYVVRKPQRQVLSQQGPYGKWSKILNTFLFLFWSRILFIRVEIHKMLNKTANREESDQTASSEAV